MGEEGGEEGFDIVRDKGAGVNGTRFADVLEMKSERKIHVDDAAWHFKTHSGLIDDSLKKFKRIRGRGNGVEGATLASSGI